MGFYLVAEPGSGLGRASILWRSRVRGVRQASVSEFPSLEGFQDLSSVCDSFFLALEGVHGGPKTPCIPVLHLDSSIILRVFLPSGGGLPMRYPYRYCE